MQFLHGLKNLSNLLPHILTLNYRKRNRLYWQSQFSHTTCFARHYWNSHHYLHSNHSHLNKFLTDSSIIYLYLNDNQGIIKCKEQNKKNLFTEGKSKYATKYHFRIRTKRWNIRYSWLSVRLLTKNNMVNHVTEYVILLWFQWCNFPPTLYRLWEIIEHKIP